MQFYGKLPVAPYLGQLQSQVVNLLLKVFLLALIPFLHPGFDGSFDCLQENIRSHQAKTDRLLVEPLSQLRPFQLGHLGQRHSKSSPESVDEGMIFDYLDQVQNFLLEIPFEMGNLSQKPKAYGQMVRIYKMGS